MTILQRRLAEIEGRGDAPAVEPVAPSATALPNAAGETQVELPAQGAPEVPAGQPVGAGTAEAPAEAFVAGLAPAHLAPDPGTPEAAAAAETAHFVPDAVTVDGHDISAPEARAVAHYGADMTPHPEALPAAPEAEAEPAPAPAPDPEVLPAGEHIASAAPAPVADPETQRDAAGDASDGVEVAETAPAATVEAQAPEVPTVALAAAPDLGAALDAAPEGVAHLPTSEATPLDAAPANVAAIEAGEEPTGAPAAAVANPVQDESSALVGEAADDATETAAADADVAVGEEAPAPDAGAPDFTGLDLPAQAAYLVVLIRRPDARRQRKQILDLTRQYEANVGLVRSAARQKFAEGGEGADAFAFQQPEGQPELNKALQEFREGRAQDAKSEDASRGDNLIKKKALLDQLRGLVEAAETKDSSGKLKALQGEWKATGAVPQTDSQAIWDTYHGLLDIYYSKQGRFLEMKDLDRRRNLEAKEVLIKRAEGLATAPGINKALDELTKLHEDWKHIGPVPNEQREPLWQRFIAASDVLHQRRKEFSDQRSGVEKANLVVKQVLLERVLPFADFDTDRVNLWRSKTDELQEIKAEWEAAGLVPRAQADALNKQYWAAYKAFFNRKNDFFKSLDNEKSANVKAKVALIEQAEEALNNPDGDAARQVVMRVQKEWKDVGRVPDKLADKLWHRFRGACDAVFDRPKHEARQREEKVQASSAEQTAALDRLSEQVSALSPETSGSLEGYRALLAGWAAEFDPTDEQPGRGTADRSEEQLLALLGQYLDHVPGLAYADRAELLFQTEVARLKARPQAGQQLTRKEMALRKEINELENDAATLQTNLAFFARSKNAAQLRAEYEGRIAEGQQRIDVLKKQLKLVRS